MYTKVKERLVRLMACIHTNEGYCIATTDTECPLYLSCPYAPNVATNDHIVMCKCKGLNLRIAMR